jgi:pimeloyl-ACP methyl ester carboxylesterase
MFGLSVRSSTSPHGHASFEVFHREVITVIWAIVGLFAFVVLADILIQWNAVRIVLTLIENSPPFRIESLPPDPDAEPFSVRTSDGITLRGCLYRHTETTPRGLIVFCPEFASNHRSAMLYCSALSRAGFHVLSFDFRNHGDSDSMPGYVPLHWLTQYEITDLNTVINHVYSQPDLNELPLGLFGISRGGGAALYVAAQRSEVLRVATEGAYGTEMLMLAHARHFVPIAAPPALARLFPDWHIVVTITLVRWISQRRRNCRYAMIERVLPQLASKPAFVISGARDTYVRPEVAREITRLIRQTDALWIVDKAKHNLARSVDPVEYDRRLVEFFTPLDELNKSSETQSSPSRKSKPK